MNFEVCKKCNKILQLFKGKKQYTLACYDSSLIYQRFIKSINLNQGNNLLKHSEILEHRNYDYGEYFWIKFKDYVDIEQNRIIIDECCPYYVEHMISDLNHKKTS